MQQAEDPSEFLTQFLNSTYEAAAEFAKWDRQRLEFANFQKNAKKQDSR